MAKSKKSSDDLFSFDDEKEPLPEIKVGDVHNGVKVTGNFEADTKAELSETLKRFKEQANAEGAAKTNNTNTEYWFAAYFATQAQRDAFLTAVGLIEKLQDQYLDGAELAKALGVSIPNDPITTPKRFRGLGKDQVYDIFDID